jgi:6-phosphogluconolactonase
MNRGQGSQPGLSIFDTPDLLYDTAALAVVRLAERAVAERGRFLLVVSGGDTPLPLFERLAQPPHRGSLPWARTHVFWADERMAPPDSPASNFGQAWSALLRHVPIPEEQIHPIEWQSDASASALDYTNELGALAGSGLPWPRFDLVLLGLGADGHTASLFPGRSHTYPADAAAVAVQVDYAGRPAERVSLTPAAINGARDIIFLVTGKNKAQALARALIPGSRSEELPARLMLG